MALAMHYPKPEKGGRGKKSEAKTAQNLGGFGATRLDQARTILAYSHDLAAAHLFGGFFIRQCELANPHKFTNRRTKNNGIRRIPREIARAFRR